MKQTEQVFNCVVEAFKRVHADSAGIKESLESGVEFKSFVTRVVRAEAKSLLYELYIDKAFKIKKEKTDSELMNYFSTIISICVKKYGAKLAENYCRNYTKNEALDLFEQPQRMGGAYEQKINH